MKLALIGYGKMGRLISDRAKERSYEVVSIDPHVPEAHFSTIDTASLEGVDVCIDFSHPEAVVSNIKQVANLGKNLVVGSTGWYDQLDQVRDVVDSSKIGFLYASNFSIGVQLFFRTIRVASKYFNKFNEYDVAGFELHHNQKADSPSGTAHTMAHTVLDEMDAKTDVLYGSPNRKIEAHELQVISLRCGSAPGTHEITFDSPADTVSIKHTARSREGFAIGAIQAAQWLKGKQGFYTIDDMLDQLV